MKTSGKNTKNWQVYLLKCADASLYCGITSDLPARVRAHNTGKGAKYTRGRGPVELLAAGPKMAKPDALRLEMHIKKQRAAQKINALKKGSEQI